MVGNSVYLKKIIKIPQYRIFLILLFYSNTEAAYEYNTSTAVVKELTVELN